jgi:hypothetical protein
LLELFKGDLSSGGDFIEAQSVRIVLLLPDWGSELLLLGIQIGASLGINLTETLPNHFECAMVVIDLVDREEYRVRRDAPYAYCRATPPALS